MSKKDQSVLREIQSKKGTFSPDDIAALAGVSRAKAYNVIQRLLRMGHVKECKEGRKIFYKRINDIDFENSDSEKKDETPKEKSKSIPFLSVAERFENVERFTQMVIERCTPSFLMTGSSGIGKTHVVREQLHLNCLEEGTHYRIVSGHITPGGLYSVLWDARHGQLVVFDDCDSVFENDMACNLLKAAMDSYDTRRVSWVSSRLPKGVNGEMDSQFDFEGNVIFISNVPMSKIDKAIKSRTMTMTLTLSRDEITERMAQILPYVERKVPMEWKQEVLTYINEINEHFANYHFRSLIKSIRLRNRYHDENIWKKMILHMAPEPDE